MGWFLTTKKPKKSAPKTAAKLPDPAVWKPARTLMLIRFCVAGSLIAGIAVGWVKGEQELSAYARQVSVQASVPASRIQLVDAPSWMSPKLHQELQTLVAEQVTPDPLDREALTSAVNVLRTSPWVGAVTRIERVAGGTIQVRAEYRAPVAMVDTADGCRVIDATGVLLPGVYEKDQARQVGLPVITRVAAPAPSEGTRWQGDDLHAGLDLLQFLRGQPYYSQIKAFDVGERDGKGRIRLQLITAHGMVRWGLPMGQEQPIEADPEAKRANLALLNHQNGSIDAGGKVVDVYGATVNVSMPVASDATPQVGYTLGR